MQLQLTIKLPKHYHSRRSQPPPNYSHEQERHKGDLADNHDAQQEGSWNDVPETKVLTQQGDWGKEQGCA